MEQHRASPAGEHILHHSPQKLGTTAEYVPHGITNHMMSVKLAALLGPPQHRRIHLLQCLQLCYMVHVRQGSKRISPLNAKSLCTVLVAFCGVCGLPYCLIWLATGLTGAAYAVSGHASRRTISITLHLACVLACALN
jgi:hypothetical protein